MPSYNAIDSTSLIYIHDVAVLDENQVIMTERSRQHAHSIRELDRMEHRPSGRSVFTICDWLV